ncbi:MULTISPECIES: class I SAM-dependent methyltransferase [Salinibaculum]|uniref:class I SAM-dependent methyltransferase n=1 Tax=Salinibaculum TaxID=2732368 RepID=UPI0030CAA9E2
MDRSQVKAAWERVADAYASTRRADGEDAALVGELCADLPADATVLDVGCGDGRRTLANVTGATAIGMDVARRQVELARRNVPDAHVLQGDMLSIPLADDSVDAVTAYHAVFHVDRDRHGEVYDEFARVLRPGGRVLMTVGSSSYEQVRSNWLQSGESMYFSTPGMRGTRDLLAAAGFEVVWERRVDDPLGSTVPFVLAELTD